MIQAIETVYNGYRFRSRLEARWAVFFDVLGVPYQYEVEGVKTAAGGYLPDFWMPAHALWLEIKPLGWNSCGQDSVKLSAFAYQGQRVLVSIGDPWPDAYVMVRVLKHGEALTWLWASIRGTPGLCGIGEAAGGNIFCEPRILMPEADRRVVGGCAIPITMAQFDARSPALMAAYTAARQARFEHGEHGAPRPSAPVLSQVAPVPRPVYSALSPRASRCQWKPGDKARHPTYGDGIVILSNAITGDEEVIIAFAGHGVKRMLASLAHLEKLV